MVNLTINSIPVTVPEGTTILDAAASVDIEIPQPVLPKRAERNLRLPRLLCRGRGRRQAGSLVQQRRAVKAWSSTPIRRVRARRAASMWSLSCRSTTTSARPVSARAPASCRRSANDLGILGVSVPAATLHAAKRPTGRPTFPLYRDANKCIKCMRCIQVCDKVQSLSIWDHQRLGLRAPPLMFRATA